MGRCKFILNKNGFQQLKFHKQLKFGKLHFKMVKICFFPDIFFTRDICV